MITIEDDAGGSMDWHTGDSTEIHPENVLLVQADGDELGLILRDFHNLPYHNGRVNVWFGDLAKCVAERVAQWSDKNKRFPKEK